MAGEQGEEKPKALDKGKEKAVDGADQAADGEKKEADKDAKENGVLPPGTQIRAPVDSKPRALTQHLNTEELSEEDQKLKDELDMLVERLSVGDFGLHRLCSFVDHPLRNPTPACTNPRSKPSKTQ
ncbi:MAG: hypothetical protein INR71_13235 [Terriglobus roseus]|nr:hypothetical protein [Terriglobus roseus]